MVKKIEPYFPNYELWIEPFFGAGGMFFNKQKTAKYNICNDIDGDVYNLYIVLRDNKEQLIEQIELMPIHNDLFQYWRKNKETESVLRAVRFLFLSNFSYLGKMDCLKFSNRNEKKILLQFIPITYEKIKHVRFNNTDFERFLSSFQYKDKNRAFIYADPPYLATGNNYSNSFTKDDVIRLFDVLCNSGVRFAYSEFDNEFITQQATERNLNIIKLGERVNLKNRRSEILITNYENYNGLDFE